jgi:hypothetical protein
MIQSAGLPSHLRPCPVSDAPWCSPCLESSLLKMIGQEAA